MYSIPKAKTQKMDFKAQVEKGIKKEKPRRTKEPLEKSERGELKADLKFSIQKTKIMATGPITSWQIDGETVTDLILGALKSLQMVTAAMKLKDTYSLEGKL